MSDPKQDSKPDPKQDPQTELTAAQAARLVARPPLEAGGKPVAIKADEVLSFRDYGDRVVVVTVDGQKFTGEKSATDKAGK